MNRFFKKISLGMAVLLLSGTIGTTALAQNEMSNMVFAGYDTTNPLAPNKIYNEVIDGQYTNKQILVPVTDIEWKAEGYESVFPYAGYSTLYLEGKAQKIYAYNNTFPQWETKQQDYMWEIKKTTINTPSGPETGHIIYQRQRTNVPKKGWTWDFGNAYFGIPDSSLLTRTNRFAYLVKEEMKDYGFGSYSYNHKNSGYALTADEQKMYSDFNVANAISDWNAHLSTTLSVQSLSARDPGTNQYVISDADIAAIVPIVRSNYITAKFSKNSNDGLVTKSVANEYLSHINDGWAWDYAYGESFDIVYDAKISWTAPAFEMAEPYNYYQYLIIDGVIMDGTNGKDRIFRYTGGKASPNVKWEFAFFQNMLDAQGQPISNIYSVVERKYLIIDGKKVAATDANNNPVYRVVTGEYGNTYFVVNGNTIEYWVTDSDGHKIMLTTFTNWTGTLGGLIDAYYSITENYNGQLGVVQGKYLP